MPFRLFSSDIETIATRWAGIGLCSFSASMRGQWSYDTATGACPAICDGNPCFMKPRPGAPHSRLLAAEKIVADLGHIVGVPVAPVLARRPDPPAWAGFTVASLICLKQGRPWKEGGPDLSPIVDPTLEALRVFWTWVGDTDHDGHGENLLYQVLPSGEVAVVSIDHAHALSSQRNALNPMSVPASHGYRGTASSLSAHSARVEMIKEIQGVSDEKIRDVVVRLHGLLTEAEAAYILGFLRERRDGISALLGGP